MDSAVGIATRYGLDSPGIESRWGRDFPYPSRPVLGPTQLLHNGYRVFPRVKRPGLSVEHPPHLAPRLKKKYSYTSSPPLGLRGMFQGELYLYLYIYSESFHVLENPNTISVSSSAVWSYQILSSLRSMTFCQLSKAVPLRSFEVISSVYLVSCVSCSRRVL